MGNKTAIIFGSNGQDGYYLGDLLETQGIKVVRTSRSAGDYTGNVADLIFVDGLIKKFSPDFVFHLAANSTARHDAIFENHQSISTGTLNILESIRLHSPMTKVFLSGSALQFENTGKPISETTPFHASSPYAVERIHSVYTGRYFREAFGIKVYVGYFFNHDSPLRTERHVNQKIVLAAKRIAMGETSKLTLGNIDVQKEFNFAGDIMKAVWTLMNQDEVFEAVLGCGKAYSIQDWVVYCFAKMNLNWKEHLEIDNNFKAEYNILVSDPSLILGMGWSPEVDFKGLADKMLA